MIVHVLMPVYKRPEYVKKVFISLLEGLDDTAVFYVTDDGSPGDSVRTAVRKVGIRIRYNKIDHSGIPCAFSDLLHRSLNDNVDALRLFVAVDHLFPRHWDTYVRAAYARVGHKCELGLFKHYPGNTDVQRKWEATSNPLQGLSRIKIVGRPSGLCSMPSLCFGREPADQMARWMSRGSISNIASLDIASMFKTFWYGRYALNKKPQFYITGVIVEHVGHYKGNSRHFIRTPDHIRYYEETKKTKGFVDRKETLNIQSSLMKKLHTEWRRFLNAKT